MPIQHEEVPEYPDAERKFHVAHDLKENHETTPPDGEVIGHPAIMMAECYIGGDLDRLTSGLRALGEDQQHAYEPDNYFLWADAVRRTSDSGGWTRAGSFYRKGTENHWLDDRAIEMPEDFSRIELRAYSPTPAIVVLVGVFELAADSAGALDDELRTNRYRRVESDGRVTRYASAATRKHEAVLQERLRIRESARSWLVSNVPGTLTLNFEGVTLPALDFLSTRVTRPFEPSNDHRLWHHRFLLSIDTDYEAWEATSHKGWRLAMPWRPADDEWTLVAGAIDDPAFIYHGQDAGDAKVYPHPRSGPTFHDYFGPLLVRWALLRLAIAYEGELAAVRDSLAPTPKRGLLKRRGRRNSLKLATAILTTKSFDASVFAHEAMQMAATDWRWSQEVGAWEPVDERAKERAEGSLAETLGANLERRCEWITDLDGRLREQLLAATNLEVAAVNISLQRQVFWLTVIAVIVAVAALIAG